MDVGFQLSAKYLSPTSNIVKWGGNELDFLLEDDGSREDRNLDIICRECHFMAQHPKGTNWKAIQFIKSW